MTTTVTVNSSDNAGSDYPTYTTSEVEIPNAVVNYSTPSSITSNSIFQDVNSHSNGALQNIYDAINSGAYAISGNQLVTANGNTYYLQPSGTSGLDAIVVPTTVGGTYTIPIAVNGKGQAAMPDQFITTPQAITYTGGQSGSVFGGILDALAPIAPIVNLASVAFPELQPVASALTAAEAVNHNNPLLAVAAATGIPGFSQDVAGLANSAADASLTAAQVTSAAKTANAVNQLITAAKTGNTVGLLSAAGSLSGVGATQLGNTGFTTGDAAKIANLIQAVNSGNQNAIINATAAVAGSPTIQSTANSLINGSATNATPSGTSAQSSNLPSGIQVASSDSGLPEYSTSISGVPIFADSPNASSVSAPFGYSLMPSSLNDSSTRPEGAYYDPTQNAWFMPNQDVQNLQNALSTSSTEPNANQTSNLLPAAGTNEPSATDVNAGLLPADGALSSVNGTSDTTSGLPSDLPSGDVNANPNEPNQPTTPTEPTTSTTSTEPTTPTTPTTSTTPSSSLNLPTSSSTSKTTTTPSSSTSTTTTTPSSSGSSGSSNQQGFIPVVSPWLTVGKSQEQGIQENQLQQIYNSLDPNLNQENQLQQIYNSLDPNLKQVLASKGIAPQTAASGGSIYGIEPELYKVMMSRMGYDDGGEVVTQTGNAFSDMAKTAKSMEPKFVRSDPHFLRPQNKNQSMQLGALTQLKQAPRLGGLAHGGLPSKYEENAPKGHNPEFITGITGYYAGGRGTGQSDDIPAMLHEGDHVADADVVAALGDGSSKAGKQVLDNFRQSIPHNDQSKGKPVPAMIADGEYVMPEAFVTALGQGDNKRGAQLLDIMREELRKHKRSAPDSKIPPKALSPLEYIHRGMKKSGAKK